ARARGPPGGRRATPATRSRRAPRHRPPARPRTAGWTSGSWRTRGSDRPRRGGRRRRGPPRARSRRRCAPPPWHPARRPVPRPPPRRPAGCCRTPTPPRRARASSLLRSLASSTEPARGSAPAAGEQIPTARDVRGRRPGRRSRSKRRPRPRRSSADRPAATGRWAVARNSGRTDDRETPCARRDRRSEMSSRPPHGARTDAGSAAATSGLSSAEARRRLTALGPNVLPAPDAPSPALLLLRQMTHFFALVLWVAAGLAVIGGMPQLGVAIAIVVVVNGVFAFAQEHRADRAAQRLRDLLPLRATVVRDGERKEVDATELVPGDLVLLTAGDRISADLVLEHVDRKSTRLNSSHVKTSYAVFCLKTK